MPGIGENELGVLSLKIGRILVTESKRPHWTYAIARRMSVNRGSVHLVLSQFKKRGWLVSYMEPGDKKSERVLYATTELGLTALKQALAPFQIMPAST